MNTHHHLFTGLFDDAAMFPPGNAPLPHAVAEHGHHAGDWYADMVGPFVCSDARLPELAEEVERSLDAPLDVSVVLPGGPASAASVVGLIRATASLRVTAVEVPLVDVALIDVVRGIRDQLGVAQIFVEVPWPLLDQRILTACGGRGLAIKLRTGGTNPRAFPTADELARAVGLCIAEGVEFKCTAGLHRAVRHRDDATGFEHHGFLNIALAVASGLSGAGTAQLRDVLEEVDGDRLRAQVVELGDRAVAGVRSRFRSFGTCSIAEPVDDLLALGLASVPDLAR